MPEAPVYLWVHVGYNASCAVMVGGRIVAAAQEERFTRKKKETGFPRQAIDDGDIKRHLESVPAQPVLRSLRVQKVTAN